MFLSPTQSKPHTITRNGEGLGTEANACVSVSIIGQAGASPLSRSADMVVYIYIYIYIGLTDPPPRINCVLLMGPAWAGGDCALRANVKPA